MTTIRQAQYTLRNDNYPLTYHGYPDLSYAPPQSFVVNYGNFIYDK